MPAADLTRALAADALARMRKLADSSFRPGA
jgi:hypothetical protein